MPPASPSSCPGEPCARRGRCGAGWPSCWRAPDGAILFRRRPAEGLLGGLHELPSSPWRAGGLVLEAALDHAPGAAEWRLHPRPVRHVFTHFVLELTLAEATTAAARPGSGARGEQLDRLALPSVMRKLLRQAGRAGANRLPGV